MGDNEIIIQVGNLRTLTIVSAETTTIAQNNQSYCQLFYNIKKIYLDTYDPICRIGNCFVCKL